MKREEANNFLTKIEEEMPSIEKKKFLSYAAVVENSKINNDFIIELGICLESAGLLEFHENLIDVVYEVWNSELIRKKIKEEQIIAIDCGLVDKLDKDTDGDDCCVEIRKYKKYQQKLEGGLSISNVKHFAKSGTLGCIFKLKGSKAKYAITNAHVVDYSSCKHNHKTIMHPSKSDSTFSTNIEIGNIHWICDNEYVDASIIELKSTIEIGKPLRCSTLDLDIPISPVENMTVIKCGRSTGLTQGSIRSIKCCLFIYNDNGTIKKRYIKFKLSN